VLEDEGVLGDVTIAAYDLQFIPVAEDVISLENDGAFKEIWVVRLLVSFACALPDPVLFRMETKHRCTTLRRRFTRCRNCSAYFLEYLARAMSPTYVCQNWLLPLLRMVF
jgi:hypothetical protein